MGQYTCFEVGSGDEIVSDGTLEPKGKNSNYFTFNSSMLPTAMYLLLFFFHHPSLRYTSMLLGR